MKNFIIFAFLVTFLNAVRQPPREVANIMNTQILDHVIHLENNYMGLHFKAVDFYFHSCYQGPIHYKTMDSFLSNYGAKANFVTSVVLNARYAGNNLVFEVMIGGIDNVKYVRVTAEYHGPAPAHYRIIKAEGYSC